MTATLTDAFKAHLKGRAHNRCWMLRLDLRDGTVLGFTDHDRVLSFDLADGTGSIDYRPDFGIAISNVRTGCGLDAGNFEVTFPIGEAPRPITRAAVLGGRFHYAETWLFQVIWSDPAAGARKFMRGRTGEWRVDGDKAIAESRDERDKLNQERGRILQNQCDADYADQRRCFATPTEVDVTVTAVAGPLEFTVSGAGAFATGFFNRGTCYPLTGVNANQRGVPIESSTAAGVVKLFMPMVSTPVVGDTYRLRDGCPRTRAACMGHGQILNFRGTPDVPGQQALAPANPPPNAGGGKGGK